LFPAFLFLFKITRLNGNDLLHENLLEQCNLSNALKEAIIKLYNQHCALFILALWERSEVKYKRAGKTRHAQPHNLNAVPAPMSKNYVDPSTAPALTQNRG
jgi:hypothetical protein